MTPTIASLKAILSEVKSRSIRPEDIADDADIVNDVGLDSLELLQFMLEVEARLAVQIDFDRLEYDHLSSLRTLAEFLDTMPSDAAGSP